MNIQYKTFALKVDDMDENGMIRGYASTFGNVDQGLDIVDKGAFKKSLKENGGVFPILADHNPSDHIGWNKRANEDDSGLFVEGKLDMNVQKAREKYSLAKTALALGAKMGLSIGYMTIKAEPDRDKPMVRHLKELKLFEYSIVTFPMNTEAMITSAKSLATVDKTKFIIQQLLEQGIQSDELTKALGEIQAAKSDDPTDLHQSIRTLITKISS